METLVRAARAADLEAATSLIAAADLPLDGVAAGFGDRYAVAEDNGRIVGVAGLEIYDDDALLRSVAVDPSQRGRGLGERLVLDRLRWAGEHDIRDVYLLTTTAPGFFAKLGFEQIERAEASAAVKGSEEFAVICSSSATTMRLAVGHAFRPRPRA